MTQAQRLHEFGQLAMPEQLELLQNALRLMQRSALNGKPSPCSVPKKMALADAANQLRDDCVNDEELTRFTSLDGEPVHAARVKSG